MPSLAVAAIQKLNRKVVRNILRIVDMFIVLKRICVLFLMPAKVNHFVYKQ
jgi:hypothetical protein